MKCLLLQLPSAHCLAPTAVLFHILVPVGDFVGNSWVTVAALVGRGHVVDASLIVADDVPCRPQQLRERDSGL